MNKESIATKVILLASVGLDLDQAQKVAEFSESEGLVYVTGYDEGVRIEEECEVILIAHEDYTGLMFGTKDAYWALWNYKFDLDAVYSITEERGIEPHVCPN